jgi:ribonuclease HI
VKQKDDGQGRGERNPEKLARKAEPAAARQWIIYSDGACRGNPGVGGYGTILRSDGYEKEISDAVPHTTNNRMELTAAIAGLSALKERSRVLMVTDSQYLKKGITEWIHAWRARGWKTSARKNVLNQDLWERLDELCRRHDVEWRWVRGHSGEEYNERCDQLANEAMDRYLAQRP